MKPDVSDGLLISGLALQGVGLFYWFSLGVSLAVTGFIMLGLGVAANIAEAKRARRK